MTQFTICSRYTKVMDKTIEQLIDIEQQANAVWDRLLADKALLPARIQDEAARRVAQIDRQTQRDLQTITQTAAQETLEKIKHIQADHEKAVARMQVLFAKHRDAWRAQILSCILKV